jgi:imidazolonepropionase
VNHTHTVVKSGKVVVRGGQLLEELSLSKN